MDGHPIKKTANPVPQWQTDAMNNIQNQQVL
jgi:hypothetical protein